MALIQNIPAFKTRDGRVFESEAEATEHALELQRRDRVEAWVVNHLGRVASPTFTSDEFIAALNDHGQELFSAWNTLE
jgi:hypothetical protein